MAASNGAWSSGLFSCFSDWSTCCLTFWCPCITFGRISEILDRGKSSCAGKGAAYLIQIYRTFGFPCLLSYHYRTKMRAEYDIEGSCCRDFWVHCFCEGCALCQEYRELQRRGIDGRDIDVAAGWYENERRKKGGVTMAPTAMEGGMKR